MKQSLIHCQLFIILVFSTACSTIPDHQADPLSQEETIARWHRCIDTSIDEQDQGTEPAELILESTLVTCQGHKRDVLATFPRKYESQLADLMEERAYEAGINRLSMRRKSLESVSTGFRKLLDESKAQF